MTTPGAAQSPPEVVPGPAGSTLKERAVRGVFWGIIQTVAVKGVNIGGQVLLAYLLTPAEFGAVSKVLTAGIFFGAFCIFGIYDVHVQQGRDARAFASDAFWATVLTSIAGGLGMWLSAPWVARWLGDPSLVGLLRALAVASALFALRSAPWAVLMAELRFRGVAAIESGVNAMRMILSLLLAATGFGAASMIWPHIPSNVARLVLSWRLAEPRVAWRGPSRRVLSVIRTSWPMAAGSLLICVTNWGDYLILARLVDESALGLYFWAFNMSQQAAQLLGSSIANVVFASASQIRDDAERQLGAIVRALTVGSFVVMPIALAQVAMAAPMVNLVFPAKWHAGIPLVQVFGLASAMFMLGTIGQSSLKAQGRFRAYFFNLAVSAVVFVVAVYVGTIWSGVLGAAMGVLVFNVVFLLGNLWLVTRGQKRLLPLLWEVAIVPMIAAVVAAAPAFIASTLLPRGTWIDLGLLTVGGLSGAGIYFLLARRWMPEPLREVLSIVFAARRRRGSIEQVADVSVP